MYCIYEVTRADGIKSEANLLFVDQFYEDVCTEGCVNSTDKDKNNNLSCPSTKNPINLGTGNKYLIETDYRGTGAFPLELTRYYNNTRNGGRTGTGNVYCPKAGNVTISYALGGSSGLTSRNPALPLISASYARALIGTPAPGTNWRHNYHRAVAQINATTATVSRADGKIYAFNLQQGIWTPDPDVTGKLVQLLDGTGTPTGWQYTNPGEEDQTETYDLKGKLLTVANRAGLTQTLTYSDGTTGPNGGYVLDATGLPTATALPAGLLIRVSDFANRTLQFAYDASQRVRTLTDPAGGIYRYAYDADNNLASMTYPDGKIKQYLYGEAAYSAPPNSGVCYLSGLTGILDENGARYASYWYDAQGRAYKEEHAPDLGLGIDKYTMTYNTDTAGTPVSTVVIDPLNTTRTYNLTKVQGVVKSTGLSQPGGSGCGASASNLTYDANGNVATRTDFKGNVTQYNYDLARDLETSRTEAYGKPEARTITTQWHATFRLPTLVAEPLRITTYTYDANGNVLTRTIQPTSDTTGAAGASGTANGAPRTTTYTYSSLGQVLTVDGPRSDVTDVTTYTYYDIADPDLGKRGNLASVSNVLNQVTTIDSYDANGKPTSITDPNGLVTTLSYDPRGRLTSRDTGGEITGYTYDGVGNLTGVSQPSGASYTYTYDQAHRLTDITDKDGNYIHYTLDAIGNRTKEQLFDAAGNQLKTRSRVFDALNRLYQDIGAVNQTTTYAYDANGNLTGITDPLNRQTTRGYDALNRLIGSTDAANGNTQYGYDGLDQLTKVTDPRNLITQYQRDGLGNLKQQTSPDTGITGMTYDVAGNLLTRTDAKGQLATYTYDALNRVASVTYSGGAATPVMISYQYDQGANGIGHLTGITEPTGVTSYAYDQHGRLAGESRQAHGMVYSTAYVYDAQGRLATVGYPSGRIVNYGFDTAGRINQISTDFNNVTLILASNIAYHPFGGVKRFNYGDGVTAPVQTYTRELDQDGRIASYTLNGNVNTLGYDDASQITSINNPLYPQLPATYGYDPLSRLTSYIQGNISQSYNYDADGNRSSQSLGLSNTSFSYAANSNRLTAIQGSSTYSVTQDANGATTNDGTRLYGYDLRGRLTQATTAQGVVNYEVNALGLRVRKQVLYDGTDTMYYYDAQGHLLGESPTGGATFTKEYVYLGDLPVAVLK